MRLGSQHTARFALAVTICWAIALGIAGSTEVLLFLSPAFLIAVPLVSGRYVGEELIAELIARRAPRARRRASASRPAPRSPLAWVPRGTRLVASSLAKRPPPARLLPQN